MIDNVFQAVLSACRAFCAHAQRAHIERHIVRQHDNVLRRDFVERSRIAHRFTRQVHERLRLEEQHALAAEHTLTRQCLELHAVDLLSAAGAVTLKCTEARIVTGIVVLRTRVAQSDHDPLDRLGCLCGFFFIQLLKNIEY